MLHNTFIGPGLDYYPNNLFRHSTGNRIIATMISYVTCHESLCHDMKFDSCYSTLPKIKNLKFLHRLV